MCSLENKICVKSLTVKQNKTKQNKTKQNKTKQNKTKKVKVSSTGTGDYLLTTSKNPCKEDLF
jgi:hypothetical protein